MEDPVKISVFWFRRDLRFDDNHGLFKALSGPYPVLPVFIFDPAILSLLPSKSDSRVQFIWENLAEMKALLEANGSSLQVAFGPPEKVLPDLGNRFSVQAVYANHDYEPSAINRDQMVRARLAGKGIPFITTCDQVVFEKEDILTGSGKPFSVYTPYAVKWKALLAMKGLPVYASERLMGRFLKTGHFPLPVPESFGFQQIVMKFPDKLPDSVLVRNYHLTRDIPAQNGTTRIGVHLRFGTVSIRKLVKLALDLNETWLNELVWREFFMQILYHFPRVVHSSFRPQYEDIPWRNNEQEFAAWCRGETGYPLVDAGMRELNETGFMHNRVRMVAASFLVKDLLIDWRWGEAWFAGKLLDFDLAANNGNWQWAAGTGCDAVPYFRVFNPQEQARKFDRNFDYIRKWVPEHGKTVGPKPIVDHAFARSRYLSVINSAKMK